MKLIVAHQIKDRGIGMNGKIPWSHKSDQAFFKMATIGHIVVMGRKTAEILKKPLINRRNIVLTSNKDLPSLKNFTEFASSFEEIPHDSIIIGGGEVYKEALKSKYLTSILISLINTEKPCDTFFPTLDDIWQEDRNLPIPVNANRNSDFEIKLYLKNEKFIGK